MIYFSIIIPVYKPDILKFQHCLQHICNQSFDNWEVIVLDTKSEFSLAISRACQTNSKVHYICSEERGVYKAINSAICKSRGRWIIVLGHDATLYDSSVLDKTSQLINANRLIFWRKAYYGSVSINGNNVWAKDGDIYDGDVDPKN